MDVAGIASQAGGVSQTKLSNEVQLAVLNKALDISAQQASQLINSVSKPAPNNPPNLGNQIDTFA